MAECLEGLGHDVAAVGSPAEALQVASAGFDVVLTDIFFPESDGFALARALRRLLPAARIVAVTASAGSVAADDPRRRWVDEVVSRPLSLAALDLLLSS
jgi:two-component system capsular synthesis sensor histidine kinase RcsC